MRHLIQTKKALIETVKFLDTQERLSHDTETYNAGKSPDISGLHPFHGARAFSHIFATRDDEFYLDFNIGGINRKHIIELAPIFSDKTRLIFYINAIFDNTILYVDGIFNECRIADGPALARIDYNGHGKNAWDEASFLSMDYLAQYYLKRRKNDLVKKYIKENDLYAKDVNNNYIMDRFKGDKIPLYNKVPIDLMFPYGCDDGRETFDICTKIIQCINYKDSKYNTKMINVAKNEIALTSEVLRAKISGLKVWVPYVEDAIKKETGIHNTALIEVAKHAPGVNINSGNQVGKYLESKGVIVARNSPTENMLKSANKNLAKINELENKLKTSTKERSRISILKQIKQTQATYEKNIMGNYNCDADAIELMAKENDLPFLNQITIAKRAQKKIATYYGNFIKLKDEHDIVRCGINQETAKTGRLGCSAPNLMNLHKEKWEGVEFEF